MFVGGLAVLVGLLAAGTPPPAINVGTPGQFAAAVSALRDSGGTILLRPGVYRDQLVVPPRSRRPLRIVGGRGVRVARILLDRTQHVSIERLRLSPAGADAWIRADASRDVTVRNVLVTAAGTRRSASVLLRKSDGVTIRGSEFTHCGDRSPAFVNCLLLGWSSHVTVEDSRFHDCLGCDFVHGRFGHDFSLLRNRLERTLPCRIGRIRCGHQDLVELFAGRGLRVVGNHFGVYRIGGAQLYLTDAIDHVRVVDNVFLGRDPRVPGYSSRVAMIIGSAGFARVPHDVRVVNNTILTGAPRVDGYAGSIRMSSLYGRVPRTERPILANNVIGLLEVPKHVCSEVRASIANVILRGRGCSPTDRVGAVEFDAAGRPTPRSRLVIDRADPRYAPARDASGQPRRGRSDIGAYELTR